MSGYLDDEEATDAAFAHGWFHSGDAGRFGEDGVLWFEDRFKDVIKTGGENVASIEVEKAVYAADPRVAEAVVVGLPHARWSEAVTAVVVPKPGESIDPAELIAAVKTRLDGFKVPKAVIFADQLPKTSTGKIQKNVLRSGHRQALRELTSVPVLISHVDPGDGPYRGNRAAQARRPRSADRPAGAGHSQGGGGWLAQRHRDPPGELGAGERIELLVDRDTAFLELCALAAWGTGFTVGAFG